MTVTMVMMMTPAMLMIVLRCLQVDLVFLVDSSASVGGVDFQEEIKFVRKLLADFTVDVNTTRVAVITFSSREKVVRQVDHLTSPHRDNHKCSLLVEEVPRIKYVGGGTYTLGAFVEAKVSVCVCVCVGGGGGGEGCARVCACFFTRVCICAFLICMRSIWIYVIILFVCVCVYEGCSI